MPAASDQRPPPRAEEEAALLRLWGLARRQTQRRLRATLAGLHRGEGGFYEVDDLWQDLFIAFQELFRAYWRPAGGLSAAAERELLAVWREAWRNNARRVLQHRPQRLWRRREPLLQEAWWALEREDDDVPAPALRAALSAAEQPEQVQLAQATAQELAAALRSLPARYRLVLYLYDVAELDHAAVARCLNLRCATTARHYLWEARCALRQAWRTLMQGGAE